MKIGVIIIKMIIASVEPISVRRIASCPRPLSKKLCPGRTLRTVSSSGAPRNIEGMKSRKVWVIAIETMNIRRTIGVIDGNTRREVEIAIIKTARRFVWIPGMSPVIVPSAIPRRSARM